MPERLATADARPSILCVSGRRVVDVLGEMGVHTVFLSDPTPIDLACLVDLPLDLDLDDWAATEAVVRGLHDARPFAGVLSVYDAYLPLAGYLAARLDVAGLALPAAFNCDNKLRMRLTLEAGGIAGPAYAVVGDPDEAAAAARRLGYPVVVKKMGAAGGRGTRLCRSPEEVAAAVTALWAETSPNLLVEEHVEGPEYAVQTVTVGGATEVISVLAQHTATGARPVETGYDFPSGLGDQGEVRLGAFVARALRALGVDSGIAHTQVRLGPAGPAVINVSARPPGGRLCEVTEAVSGVDMVRAAIEVALGRPVTRRSPVAGHVMYRCVAFDTAGTVDYDPGALAMAGDGPACLSVSMDVEPGERVLPVDHVDGGVYGRVVVYADTAESLEPAYRRAVDALRPRLKRNGT
ncbi:ATP-grasp domain-containing protein [Sphaerimonospora thailandensis]|uniref:Carboxylase n=1 Tax=Sphaerimonospora thailandensis TaxID=795644 RepID=A0A8J3RDD1_9ACTN|nr:ATP-grasp domain-containing protein [Sphaerimonospora thailandensis]GIH72216.1 carboxylase [Sphaerimonospora thailandensis]